MAAQLHCYSKLQCSGAAGFCDGLSHHGVARSGAWRIICCCLSLLAVCPGEGCAAPRKGTKIVEASGRWMDERMRLGRGDFACIRGHRHAAYLCLNMLLSVVIVILISAPIFSDLRPRANTTSTTGPVQPLRVSSGFRFFDAFSFTDLFFFLSSLTSRRFGGRLTWRGGGHLGHTFLFCQPRMLSLPEIRLNQWRRAPGKKQQQYG